MALFGVPKAHEDDPVRAIKAAQEIHGIVFSISPKYEKRIGRPLSMHTGICTGLVVTGNINLKAGTHGVVGDTINTASRLSKVAKPGEIVVNAETYNQTQGFFTFDPLEATAVKGKKELLKLFKVLSYRKNIIKTHRITGLRAELIGRKLEISNLNKALEKLENGKNSIFSIEGDAGTGKSRLIEEFKSSINSEAVQWKEGHAYAYSQKIPYFPFLNLLGRSWGVHEGDSIEQIRHKVEEGSKSCLGDRIDLIPLVGSLYSLAYPEIEQTSPENWKARLHEAIRLILENSCKSLPSIICLEDLHWSDSASIELLNFILKELNGPAIFILTYRPPFNLFKSQQLIGTREIYNDIKIQELSASDTQAMVKSLLKTNTIPADLNKFIQSNIEGNPFYLEEAINSLIESETLIRDQEGWKLTKQVSGAFISSTIQGIITARMDRLEWGKKRILQEASVIGRVFLYEILRRITDLKDGMANCLLVLEKRDFIRKRHLQPDLEYIFKHALTQEVVYSGLLKKERQVLHERIGRVIENLFHDRLPEFYETLAYHFSHGQSPLKAVDYLLKAGEKSFRRCALDESDNFFKEAFTLLANKTQTKEEHKNLLIELIIKWGYTLHLKADFVSLSNLFKSHEALVESHASQEHLVMFYGWLGFALSRREKLSEGYTYLCKALQIAEKIGDAKAIGYNCAWLIHACADMDLLRDAIIYGERAREAANRYLSDEYLFGISYMFSAYAHFFSGDVKKTAGLAQELLEYGKRRSDVRSIAFHYFAMGMSRLSAGDISSAINLFKKGLRVSPDPMTSQATNTLLGRCYIATGQIEKAQNALTEVIQHSEKFGYEITGTIAHAFKGMVLIAQGDLNKGISLYEKSMQLFWERKSLIRYASGNLLMGMVYSKIAQRKGEKKSLAFIIKNFGFLVKTVPFANRKAEEHFNLTISISMNIGAKSLLGQAYFELGKLYKNKGKSEVAHEYFTSAINTFEKCNADVYLRQSQEALASLEINKNDPPRKRV
jgi:predicted ATPase